MIYKGSQLAGQMHMAMLLSGVARIIERGFLNVCARDLIFMTSAQNSYSFGAHLEERSVVINHNSVAYVIHAVIVWTRVPLLQYFDV